MSWVDRLRLFAARGLIKSSAAVRMPEWLDYAFVEPTYRRLVYEGYRANSIVFACAETMAFAFTEPRLKVVQEEDGGGTTPLPKHPLARLLRRPMPKTYPQMSGTQLLQATIINAQIGGDAYWWKRRQNRGIPGELWPLNNAQLAPINGGDKLVDHYEFTDGDGNAQNIPVRDIVHFKWIWDPLSPWKGMSPLIAAAREVDTDNEAARYVFNVLKNDAIPRLAITAPAEADFSDPDKRKRLRESWQESQGGNNRGMPAFLWGGLQVERLSLDLNELAFEGLRRLPETRICATLRVPPVVAGLLVGLENSGGLNSNASEAAKWMTERTLVPLWRSFEETISASLLPDFGEVDDDQGIVVAFDLSTVFSLQEALKDKREWVDQAVTTGYLTVNEGRAELGKPRDAGGDIFLRGFNVVEVPASLVDGQGKPLKMLVRGGSGKGAAQDELEVRWGKARAESFRRSAAAMINAQRKIRLEVAKKMEPVVADYFEELSKRVAARAQKTWTPSALQRKKLPSVDDLLLSTDDDALEGIVSKYYGSVIQASWDIYNVTLGVDLAFDLTDPMVTAILGTTSKRVRLISDTTRESLRTVLQIGSDAGWSVDQLVRGDPEQGIPGIRDIIEETYAGRAKTVARTELGNAQNAAACERFAAAGIEQVLVLDNGNDDDDEACKKLNGTVQTIDWAKKNPLQHPNCTRATAPIVPGME